MPRVVTKACLGKKHCKCAEVCPVDCFYDIRDLELNKKYGLACDEGDLSKHGMLMINPEECIDCGACQGECPEKAIFEDSELPEDLKEFAALNRERTAEISEQERDSIRFVVGE